MKAVPPEVDRELQEQRRITKHNAEFFTRQLLDLNRRVAELEQQIGVPHIELPDLDAA